jgi:hypothetical protein
VLFRSEGNVVKPAKTLGDYLPASLKNLDRVMQEHTKAVTAKNGAWVPIRSTFETVQAQLDAETKASSGAAGAAAAEATKRTLKEVHSRRGAAGGPRSEAVPARSVAKPGKRTFADIENSGGDFIVP